MSGLGVGRRWVLAALGSALMLASCGKKEEVAAPAEGAKTEFNVGWTIYAGWMPWAYAENHGIVDKWAEKYGITINVTQINDYVESLNQFTAGKLDAVVYESTRQGSNRQSRVWMIPKMEYLAARAEQIRKGKVETVMVLQSVQ